MIIKKGTKININHNRKGVFIGIARQDFDTEIDEFYPVSLAQEKGVKGGKGKIKWVEGESVPCRASLCKLTIP